MYCSRCSTYIRRERVISEAEKAQCKNSHKKPTNNSPLRLLFATSKLSDPVVVPLRIVLGGRRRRLIELVANADVRGACISEERLLLTVVILANSTLLSEFPAGRNSVGRLPIATCRGGGWALLQLATNAQR